MPQIILIPRLFANTDDVAIIAWLKKEGDQVDAGEVVLEVETDKVAVSVEAPCSGKVYRILADAGDRVAFNKPVAVIICPGDSVEAAAEVAGAAAMEAGKPMQPAQDPGHPPGASGSLKASMTRVSPIAKRLAGEYGVDLDRITGTGPGGRITKEDVLQYVENRKSAPAAASGASGEGLPVEDRLACNEFKVSTVPVMGMRKGIADQMSLSSRTVARVTYFTEVDMEAIVRLRRTILPRAQEKAGVRLTYNHFIIKAAADTLVNHPRLNAWWAESVVELKSEINIGIAVALEDGLLTPVLRRANEKGLFEIAARAKQLEVRARDRKLGAEEFSGGTFTVSTLGQYGINGFTPIVNVPEVAILGVGQIMRKPAVAGDKVEPRWMMTLSLSFDHRAVDGVPAASFLQELKDRLENPGW